MMSDRGVLGLSDAEREFIGYLRSLGRTMGILPEKIIKGRPAVSRRVRKAARFCEAIAETYGVYVPNEPFPERLRKADPIQKVKPHFTNTEIREMGLKWVTVHPNGAEPGRPVLVQDLGDEYVVVGGAGGKMNYTRFRKDRKDRTESLKRRAEEGEKKKKKQIEDEGLTEEEYAAREAKLAEAKQQAKSARQALRNYVREALGVSEDITAEERLELQRKAMAKARKLHADEEEQRKFAEATVKEHLKLRREAQNDAIDQVISETTEAAGLEELTGQPVDPPEFSPPEEPAGEDGEKPKPKPKVQFTKEQWKRAKDLVGEETSAVTYERSIRRALGKGGEAAARAMELQYQPMSEDEQRRYFADSHLEREKIRANSALVKKVEERGDHLDRHIRQGAADAAAGLAAAACGTTILDAQTAQELGAPAAAQVIAQYIAEKTGSPKKAAEAVREYIAQESAVSAAAAVKASEELAHRADAMLETSLEGGLLSAAQANGKVRQFGNEADRIIGRAFGAATTAADVALHLERGAPAKLVIPGRSTQAGTREKAEKLGLANTPDRTTHSVRKGDNGWELHITPEGIRDLYREQSIEQYQADAEVLEIKQRTQGDGWEDEQGNPWAADGQSEDIILQPHQQGHIKLWERQKNILVSDEAGSGKTAVALCGIAHLAKQGKVKKALVVVPSTVADQMAGKGGEGPNEVEKFLDDSFSGQYALAAGQSRAKRAELYAGDQLITVITHDALRNDFEAIKAAGFDCMAVDEAHYFTTRGTGDDKGSLRAQRARQLEMPYKMLMTGTPVKNDLSELHSLADWLQPGCLGTAKEFMTRYGKLASSSGMFDEGLKRSLQARLSGVMSGITLSIEKDEDGKPVFELAPGKSGGEPIQCREETVEVGLTPEQHKIYQDTESGYLAKRKAGEKADPFARDKEHNKTVNNVEMEHHPKAVALKGLLERHPGERVVTFAQNGYSHQAIIAGLGLKKGEYAIINGDTPSSRRNAIAKALSDPSSPVKHVICSDAANFGLNMQGASVIVNWDASDTYATHRQRIARGFRKGQQRDVTVYNLRTKTPYEQTAQTRIETKKQAHKLTASAGMLDESSLYSVFRKYLKGLAT